MFLARMVMDPNDILIFGRAVAMQHQPGRDDATREDIKKRDFKAHWGHYVRVHHAEFVAGTLGNGVSLNELMDALGSNAFATTQQHAREGTGNTDPRRAYRQQPAVELSPQGGAWAIERLEDAFAQHGTLQPEALAQLDWPTTSFSSMQSAP